MNTFRNLASKWWYILLCTLIVACSDSSETPEVEPTPEPTPGPTPTEQNYRLEEGVIEIKGDNLDYIVDAVDGSTLILSDKFPSDELPSIGDIVFVYPNSKKLNHGFLGKVSEIEQSGGNYNLVTEMVDLDEAFSYLSVDETVDMELYTDEEEMIDSRLTFESINGYKCVSQPVSGKYNIFDDALAFDVESKVTFGIRREVSILVNDTTDTNTSVVTFRYFVNIGGEMHFLAEKDNGDDGYVWKNKDQLKPFFDKPFLKAKLPTGWVSFFASTDVEVNLAAKLDAALSIGLGFNFLYEGALTANCEKNKAPQPEQEKESSEEPVFTLLPNSEISLSGSALVGVHLNTAVRLFKRDDMKANLEWAIGPRFSGEISYDPVNDKNVYDALKDDKISSSLALVAEIGAKFTEKLEWAVSVLDWDIFTFTENYIFPDFTDGKKIAVENGMYKVASMKLKRDLVLPTPVGIAAYDENDEIMFMSEPETYRLEKNFEKLNPVKLKYENTDENNKYSLWSYVKWGDNYIKCKQLMPRLVQLTWNKSNNMYLEKNNYSFIYDDESGLISKIANDYSQISWHNSGTSEVSDKIVYDFEYDDNKESVKVNVASDIDGHKYTFDISLNEDGYIKSCKQTYYDGDVEYWTFKYNDNGHMTYMKRTEYNEDWNLVYDDAGDAITVKSNGDDGTNTLFYGTVENVSNIVFETMTGLDIYYMEVFGFVGMLGKPSNNYVVKRINNPKYSGNYNYTFSWNVDEMGFPIKVNIAEPDLTSNLNFVWEE